MELISPDDAGTALLAGILAAFNPCGFALLPAYITVIVTGDAVENVSRPRAIARAIGFGTAMTIGFVAVFIAFGLLFGSANSAQGLILPYVPYVTLVFGILLVVLGIHLLRGGELNVPGLKVKGAAPTRTFASQVLYGIGFALASMSCTIGPFLAVVAVSFDAPNPVAAGLPFVIYGLGMGTSVLTVSLIAAVAGGAAVAALRRHMGTLMRITSIVMILVGLYVFLYGMAEVLPSFGVRALDPFLTETAAAQASLIRSIDSLGPAILTVVAAIVVGGSIALWAWSRITDRRTAAEDVTADAD